MATIHAHPTFQAITVEHGQGSPISSTLTDPNLLLPYRDTTSSPHHASNSSFLSSDTEPSPSSSTGFTSPLSTESFEIGTAKAFLMPIRPKPSPPVSNPLKYGGYEHGAPLSAIGEEETTPRSKRARSKTPSPPASPPTIAPQAAGWWSRKSEKRLSEMSTSSNTSIGSDLQWEGYDTKAGMSERLKADLAAAGDDNFATDGVGTKRDSTATIGDDENSSQALSKRAEQILANAKKRLMNMEGNLSRARTSLLVTPKGSPTMGEHKQVGGLYRSISQGGDRRLSQGSNVRKLRPLYSLTTGANPVHARNLSETSVPSGSTRYPKPPEVRSASAMEYGYSGKSIDSLIYEKSETITNGHSPGSARWQSSPLPALQEEDSSPSTSLASPDASADASETRGLGIRNHTYQTRKTSYDSGRGLTRSQSQISTRELRDQMNGLKNKIEDLRTEQRADQFRRNSLQNLRTPSPVTTAEEWYAGAAEYKGGSSPLSTNAGMGWRAEKDLEKIPVRPATSPGPSRSPRSPEPPRSPTLALDSVIEDPPNDLNPAVQFGQDLHSYSSTPNPPPILRAVDDDRDDQNSYIQESHYEDASDERSDEAEYTVAASEEEQIYLNEVLEESLQEVEPEVPPIPDVIQSGEPERHEDRADAFDYENFFLHSALGNYAQTGFHRRNISQATAASRASYESSESVETTRAPQSEENEGIFGDDAEPEVGIEAQRTDGTTSWQDEPRTPTAPNPPFPLLHHLRSNSIDSVSSSATFATATEGGGGGGGFEDSSSETDTVPSEILHWGELVMPIPNATSGMVGAWPSPPTSAPRGLPTPIPDRPNGNGPTTAPLGVNDADHAEAGNATPSSTALPTPPLSSPLPSQQLQQQQSDTNAREEAAAYSSHSSSPTSPKSPPPPQTSVLISALITLANPDFNPQSQGTPATAFFSELDQDLVVNLLRAVGVVCEGISGCESGGDGAGAREWRGRLGRARRVLEGAKVGEE